MSIPTLPIFIKGDGKVINTNLIQQITRMMITTTLPGFQVSFIKPGIAYVYPQKGIGYIALTKFINSITKTSAFIDLGSTVVNFDNVFAMEKITNGASPPLPGYRVRFVTTEKDEDLIYWKGSAQYAILNKRFML